MQHICLYTKDFEVKTVSLFKLTSDLPSSTKPSVLQNKLHYGRHAAILDSASLGVILYLPETSLVLSGMFEYFIEYNTVAS